MRGTGTGSPASTSSKQKANGGACWGSGPLVFLGDTAGGLFGTGSASPPPINAHSTAGKGKRREARQRQGPQGHYTSAQPSSDSLPTPATGFRQPCVAETDSGRRAGAGGEGEKGEGGGRRGGGVGKGGGGRRVREGGGGQEGRELGGSTCRRGCHFHSPCQEVRECHRTEPTQKSQTWACLLGLKTPSLPGRLPWEQ